MDCSNCPSTAFPTLSTTPCGNIARDDGTDMLHFSDISPLSLDPTPRLSGYSQPLTCSWKSDSFTWYPNPCRSQFVTSSFTILVTRSLLPASGPVTTILISTTGLTWRKKKSIGSIWILHSSSLSLTRRCPSGNNALNKRCWSSMYWSNGTLFDSYMGMSVLKWEEQTTWSSAAALAPYCCDLVVPNLPFLWPLLFLEILWNCQKENNGSSCKSIRFLYSIPDVAW